MAAGLHALALLLACNLHRLTQVHDTQLFTISTNQTNLGHINFTVDPRLFFSSDEPFSKSNPQKGKINKERHVARSSFAYRFCLLSCLHFAG